MNATLDTKFKKGTTPWNKGVTGYMSSNSTSFKVGMTPWNIGLKIPTGLVKAKDITGQKFGRWTAVERTTKLNNYWQWIFKCDCGTKKELKISVVTGGDSKSCGCYQKELNKVGHPHSAESKKKLSLAKQGVKNPQWKGGVTSEIQKIRNSIELKEWKLEVLKKYDFTCQKTGLRGGKLAVHHIQNFSSNPELRFSAENGIVLGYEVHKNFHKKYGVKNNTKEQIEEFINKIL